MDTEHPVYAQPVALAFNHLPVSSARDKKANQEAEASGTERMPEPHLCFLTTFLGTLESSSDVQEVRLHKARPKGNLHHPILTLHGADCWGQREPVCLG